MDVDDKPEGTGEAGEGAGFAEMSSAEGAAAGAEAPPDENAIPAINGELPHAEVAAPEQDAAISEESAVEEVTASEQADSPLAEVAVSHEAPVRRSHVAPALIPLDQISDDATFQMRPEGDLSLLATDLARLGQLFPVDVRLVGPDEYQVICGFRRVAALRFLQREKVLARLHTDLSDEDALTMALCSAIHGAAVTREELESLRSELEAAGRLDPAARDMLDKALTHGDPLAPETVEQEIDAAELASDVTQRLGNINQDLSALADVFGELDEEQKRELLTQLRYSADLVAFLEEK